MKNIKRLIGILILLIGISVMITGNVFAIEDDPPWPVSQTDRFANWNSLLAKVRSEGTIKIFVGFELPIETLPSGDSALTL